MFRDHLISKRQCCKVRVQSVEVWEVMLENCGFMSCQETPTRTIVGSVLLQVHTLLLFSLFIQPFWCWNMVTGWRRARSPAAGQRRRSSPSEKQRVIDSKLFLDEYPQWGLGTPHQSVILHEMFLHAAGWGQKEAEHMCHQGHQSSIPEPNPEVDQSAMELVGYWTSRKEIRDVYHSVYLLRRSPGSPLLQGIKKEKGYTGYTLLPADSVTEADILCQSWRSRHPWRRVGWIGPTAILWGSPMGHPPESLGDCWSTPEWPGEARWWTQGKVTSPQPEEKST